MAAVRWILFDMRNRCWVSLGKAVIVNRLILRDFIMSFRLITIKEALRTDENEKCLIWKEVRYCCEFGRIIYLTFNRDSENMMVLEKLKLW